MKKYISGLLVIIGAFTLLLVTNSTQSEGMIVTTPTTSTPYIIPMPVDNGSDNNDEQSKEEATIKYYEHEKYNTNVPKKQLEHDKEMAEKAQKSINDSNEVSDEATGAIIIAVIVAFIIGIIIMVFA